MKYINVFDSPYRGFDISVYEHEDYTATCDVKKECGELVRGKTDFPDVFKATEWAVRTIDELTYKKRK